ncbi:MAG: prolyl oligopeptidase family serine peptidase [Prolixibacteraceae bacterium]|jgi:prolyl oligopeptidase|nr:prolyl oligopeptidase family serine peptidase [Prolixibacteraceae bacterium]
MNKLILLFLALIFMASCTDQKIEYPLTKKVEVSDDYFGTVVKDPYRWLENDTSAETAEWVKAQNEVTFAYLEKLPYREQIRNRLTELMDYPRYSTPFKEAGKYYFFKNNGLQNQSVLYVTDELNGEPREVLDPNKLSEDGTVALSGVEITEDGKYMIYKIARSGSDWNEIFVKNLETGELLQDHIKWVKFSGLDSYNDGFFYSAYDKPVPGSELSNANEYHKIYFHKIGTTQADDQLIYEDREHAKRNCYAGVSEDNRFLIVSMSETTSGNALSVKNLNDRNGKLVSVIATFDNDFNVVGTIGDNLYALTNCDAPKYKLIKFNLKNPEKENWEEIIPEKENVLQSAGFIGNKIVALYMKDAHSVMQVFSHAGSFEYDVKLPGIGAVNTISGKMDDPVAFYDYTSFNTPGEIYKFDLANNESTLHYRPEVKFNPDDFEVKQEFYISKDDTKIPMFIVHKKGLVLNGKNPALLYAYGGFNISLAPSFSTTRLAFFENGGVYAVANLRGGGEYGEEWHLAGTKMNKQNVFDDFIAAAEYLIAQKYTSNDKLAIMGGSNGGLLIGAVLNQRPDLFKVAFPLVGVMDMLRYHQFTIGWAWAGDYGKSDDSREMFEYLYHYSPYHTIIKGGKYPAVLAGTADHDDRVVPAHTFKYMARLQEYNSGKLPVLVRIDVKAGHGAGKPTAKVIDEYTDLWSFLFYHLDMKM